MILEQLLEVAGVVRGAGVPATVDVASPPQEPGPAAVVVDDQWTPLRAPSPACPAGVWQATVLVLLLAGGWDREQISELREAADRVLAALTGRWAVDSAQLDNMYSQPCYSIRVNVETQL